MATGTIGIKAVGALRPGQTIWDAGHKEAVRGFGCRRQLAHPYYVLKYRVIGGRQRFLTIGPHGSPWTPETARREAKKLLGMIAGGKDPADQRKQASLAAADTIGRIVDDYLAAIKPTQRPKTHSEARRYLRKVWKPIHPNSIHTITRLQIAARLTTIETERGATSAARARSALSTMFKWAIGAGYDVVNPVTGTNQPPKPKSRKRVLTDAELATIWSACEDDDYGRIVRLLILTGQRREEVGGLRRDEIDGDLCTIFAARYKTKLDHVVPLTPQAKALIATALRETNRDFAFGRGPRSVDGPERGFSGFSKSKAELDARILADRTETDPDAQPLPHWTLHDLRRTARSLMSRAKVPTDHAERVLGHVIGGVRETYDRYEYLDEKRDALARLADLVTAIVQPKADTGRSNRGV